LNKTNRINQRKQMNQSDGRDGPNGKGLADFPLRAFHRKVKAQVEVEGREDVESD
jgi:hypothetical protein